MSAYIDDDNRLSPRQRLELVEHQVSELKEQIAELNKFAWKAADIIRTLRMFYEDEHDLSRRNIESRIAARNNSSFFRGLRFFFK